jgi:hypothetical protein
MSDAKMAIGYIRANATDFCGQAVEYLDLFLKIAIFWPRVRYGYLNNSKSFAIKKAKLSLCLIN